VIESALTTIYRYIGVRLIRHGPECTWHVREYNQINQNTYIHICLQRHRQPSCLPSQPVSPQRTCSARIRVWDTSSPMHTLSTGHDFTPHTDSWTSTPHAHDLRLLYHISSTPRRASPFNSSIHLLSLLAPLPRSTPFLSLLHHAVPHFRPPPSPPVHPIVSAAQSTSSS
jgi:hypothetical protein